jgi:dolichyl-phosphate beta-glucosyltransferase
MDLSIVIPAYNEAHKISRDIKEAADFFQENNLSGEIIVVDDGSSDDTAATTLRVGAGLPVRVLQQQSHHGKGYAVRQGILAAQGQIIMFADSGVCTPYHHARTGMDLINQDLCDLAHGSRKLKDSIISHQQPFNRRVISTIIRRIFILWLKVPAELTDTQCGFKIYRGPVAQSLYAACQTQGFLFDVEIILRALRQGLRIREFPIVWRADHDSRLSTRKNFFGIIIELFALKKILNDFEPNKPEPIR